MNDNKLKFCFVGLYEDQNLGDPIIADCAEWLYTHNLKESDYEIKRLCIDYVEKHNPLSFVKKCCLKCLRLFYLSSVADDIYNEHLIEEYKKYFSEGIKNSDIVIVVGGGLIKYNYQFFGGGLVALLDSAEKLGVKVILNSVGVEGYDETNIRCQTLKKALNGKSLVSISTRDDIKTLREKYFDGVPNIPCEYVCDPAVWCSEVYGIERNSRGNVIGLGIARGNLFYDYGIDLNASEVSDLYKNIIKKLLNNGYQVELFTNGLDADNFFAQNIQTALESEGIDLTLVLPSDAKHLVRIIASYEAIIATRLHSCIIAYSLDIPGIGLVWNDKQTFFGRNINAENYFIQVGEFDSYTIVERLKTAINNGYNQEHKDIFRNLIIDNVNLNSGIITGKHF